MSAVILRKTFRLSELPPCETAEKLMMERWREQQKRAVERRQKRRREVSEAFGGEEWPEDDFWFTIS